jgi:catechol 2,3-dioxygenase-like lactoylglutathione lyase family enzyme
VISIMRAILPRVGRAVRAAGRRPAPARIRRAVDPPRIVGSMLDRFPVTAVLPAQDGDRARRFYRDVLGLQLVSEPDEDPIVFRAGDGTTVLLTELPDRRPADHPVLSFTVRGIEQLVPALKERGATFVPLSARGSYADGPGRVPDVADLGLVKSAFLRDSEGNVLTLNQLR